MRILYALSERCGYSRNLCRLQPSLCGGPILVAGGLRDLYRSAQKLHRRKIAVVEHLAHGKCEDGNYLITRGVPDSVTVEDHLFAQPVTEKFMDEFVNFLRIWKRSGFFHTDLDLLLKELGIDTVIMTGLHAHMCVRHTSADAYQLGYNVVVAKDATDSFTEEDYNIGIKYLKEVYGAEISDVDTILSEL